MPYSKDNPSPDQKTARIVACVTPDEKKRIDAMLEAEGLAYSPECYAWIMPRVETWEKKNGIAPA
jgi:uncharacterized protein YdaU (DUF1376 family)